MNEMWKDRKGWRQDVRDGSTRERNRMDGGKKGGKKYGKG